MLRGWPAQLAELLRLPFFFAFFCFFFYLFV
jgi:hypothetical protein